MAKKADSTTGFCGESFSAFGGHPLHVHVATLKAAAAVGPGPSPQLAELGVTDAEQLVALANADETRHHLQATLKITKGDLDSLVKEARKTLPFNVAAQMDHPISALYGLGAVEPPPEAQPVAPEVPAPAAAPPATVNMIAHMSAIRQQGQRGTCVSFALTAINEYYLNVRGNPQDLSEQDLYNEMKKIDGSPTVCGTAQFYGAKVLASRGECREIIWPYNPNLPCNNNGVMPAGAPADAAHSKLTLQALNSKDVTAIKAALASLRPVGISIPVYNSWYTSPETQRSGRITMPLVNDPQVGGHAVCLAGYQDTSDSPGGGYFILRNSWGTGWGYQDPYGQGYGVIPYQYITNYCYEAYAQTTSVNLVEPATSKEESRRTVTITIRGNVNFVIE